MRMWWPQWVQTSWLASQSRMNSICSHLGHFSQRVSGVSLREIRALSLGRTKFVSQFMAAVSHEPTRRPRRPGSATDSASTPESAERCRNFLGFLHLAEQFSRLVVGAQRLRRGGLEIGDDGGLLGHLVGGDWKDPFLAEPREAKPRDVGLADIVGMPRRPPVRIGAE